MLIAKPKNLPNLRAFIPPLLVALVLIGGFFAVRMWFAPHPAPSVAMPVSPAIEEKWGIRITQIGVTADGGLVDFRYIVLDPVKALAMAIDVKNLPVLIAEENGMVVNSAAMMAPKHTIYPGQTYFLLYRNTHGAIKPGEAVSVEFGDLRLEHVIAK